MSTAYYEKPLNSSKCQLILLVRKNSKPKHEQTQYGTLLSYFFSTDFFFGTNLFTRPNNSFDTNILHVFSLHWVCSQLGK